MSPVMVDFDIAERGSYTDYGVSGYSLAVKLSRNSAMGGAFAKRLAEEMMLSIALKCEELGARAIGHIKSHMSSLAGTIRADTIGVSHGAYSTGDLKYPVRNIFMSINCVVQGIPEEAVKAATLEGILEITENRKIFVVKEKEHAYFDEFDLTITRQNFLDQEEDQSPEYETEDDI